AVRCGRLGWAHSLPRLYVCRSVGVDNPVRGLASVRCHNRSGRRTGRPHVAQPISSSGQ
uniref:Uncharacterized protein n=1 Tax=Anopheles albimanus TaxID=7167 RepID=A0A182FYB6_ANOAL